MEAIKIEVTGNIAKVIDKPTKITSGTVGLPVEFTFDIQWNNLRKVAVFQAGDIQKDMVVVDGATVVPIEIMVKPNVRMHIGVYGMNEDGSVAIPTIWANAGKIYAGAVPGGDPGSDIGTAKQQYDEAVLAAERAETAVDRAEEAATKAESAKEAAVRASESAAASAVTTGEAEEYIAIQKYKIEQSVGAAINAQHYAEEAATSAEQYAQQALNAESYSAANAVAAETAMFQAINAESNASGYAETAQAAAERAGTAADRAEAAAERAYELIETITLEEEVSNITRTQEPDGTPYNFAGCMLRATIPAAEGKSGNAVIHYTLAPGKALTSYMIAPVSATATLIGFSRAWTDHGRWMTGWWTCRSGAGEFATYYENPYYQGMHGTNDGYMSRLEIVYSSKFPVGTVIEIWGVRV